MERFRSTSHRVFSARSIFTFVLVVIITTLFSVIIGGQATHAADPTDAAWNGESIVHSNHGYTLVADFKDPTGTIPDESTVYQTPVQTSDNGDKKVFILYFTPGVDPPTATTAKYVEFNYSATGELSDPKNAKNVTLTVKGQEDAASSCSVSGIGWIICPVSVFLAEAMDNVFNILSEMIKVQPSVLGDPNNSMYIAWNVMRNIANIAFVIVFLIIIYSQLTSFGVSNYGIKKLIPRLIIAAILVNLSFIVSAIAIDISNVLGYSIQNVFNGIRESVFNLTDDNFGAVNAAVDNPWSQLTTVILAGGGAVGGVYYMATGGLYMLIPLLLGLILTLIFVVIVLAARQAIIVILVIIAPIAFVANLLPNTEKWFEKWKDLFFTMLIFFPAFSLVFGGSQLAGQLIIQNAGGNIVTVLFGLAVQIAPLVITPLLLKFSGSLLGRIAQIANNPSKGILDRNKNWAGSRAEYTKQRNIAGEGRKFNPTTWGAGMVRGADFRKRRLQDRTNALKQGGDNLYHDSEGYKKIHTDMTGKELDKDKIQNRNASHIEGLKTTPGSELYDRAIKTQASKENLEAATNRTNEHFNQRRVVGGTLNTSSTNLEASKARLETSENSKAVYFNQQRLLATSVLGKTVEPLETSKLRAESTQNQYAKMVEDMKAVPTSSMYNIAQGVQSSKENLESSQSNTQALFDQRRRTVGSGLNVSTIELENSKVKAGEAKSMANAYISEVKANPTTDLYRNVIHAEEAKATEQEHESNLARTINEVRANDKTVLNRRSIRAEDAKIAMQTSESVFNDVLTRAKLDKTTDIHRTTVDGEIVKSTAQVSETKLERMVGEFKSGQIDRTTLSAQDEAAMDAMFANTKLLSAEKQGVQSATYEQQQRVSQVLASDTAEADSLLTIAGSVDENGKQRALATALAQRSRSRSETLGNIRSIINYQNFNTETVRKLGQGIPTPGINMSHDVMTTALQMTLGGKDTKQIVEALKQVDFSFPGATPEQREELQIYAYEALAENSSRPPFMTAGFMAMLKEGKDYNGNAFTGAYGDAGLSGLIGTAVTRQKLDSKKLQSAGKDYADVIFEAVKTDTTITPEAKQRLLSELAVTLDPAREASEALGDSKAVLYSIQDNIAIEGINDGQIDGRKLEVSSKEYAEAILSTIRRNPTEIFPAAKTTLFDEVTALRNSGNAPEIETTLDKILAELK